MEWDTCERCLPMPYVSHYTVDETCERCLPMPYLSSFHSWWNVHIMHIIFAIWHCRWPLMYRTLSTLFNTLCNRSLNIAIFVVREGHSHLFIIVVEIPINIQTQDSLRWDFIYIYFIYRERVHEGTTLILLLSKSYHPKRVEQIVFQHHKRGFQQNNSKVQNS